MNTAPAMALDEQVLRAHLARGPFQSGVDRGRWHLIVIEWPFVRIAVSAAARANGPAEYFFRFECRGYPQQAPTAQPWDEERNAPLDPTRWPAGVNRVSFVFRPDWKSGMCLYLPCDRESFAGHDAWRTQHPQWTWTPTSDITLYLRAIHELLTSSDYTGPRGT